jgi:tetratricopeptide (TPR) repeat protein
VAVDDRRYWAFLSYSHTDRAVAGWLHRALETYPIPRRLVGRPLAAGPAPRRFSPIFRDREELAADAALLERVDGSLARSAYLIVLCSPAAARSPWVEKEIVRFKVRHGEERVLAVILAGAPRASEVAGRKDQECFPAALRVRVAADGSLTTERADPIAADLRPGQDGRRLARLKLLARMLEVGLDDLVRRDLQRRQTRWVAATAAMAGVTAVTAGLAVVAVSQRDEARHQRVRAEGQVEFMLGDLTRKLRTTGRLDLLDAVGGQVLGYYAAEAPRGLDADALGRRARVLHLLGDLRDQRGDLAGASKDFQEAARTTAELLAQKPHDGVRIFNHAQSLYYLGYVAGRLGRTAEAEQAFLGYRRLALDLVRLDPARDDWRAEVGYANENLGTLWLQDGRVGQAAAAFAEARAVDERLVARAPDDRDRQSDLAGVYGWLAKADIAEARLGDAQRDLLAERAIYLRLLSRQPADTMVRQEVQTNRVQLASVYRQLRRPADAVRELEAAVAEAEAFTRLAPDNTEYRQQTALAFIDLARVRLVQGDGPGAASAARRGLALAEALVQKDPGVDLWRGYLLGGARVAAIQVAAGRTRTAGALALALQPALAESDRLLALSAARPPGLGLARVTADALLLAGDHEALAGRPDLARLRWSKAIAVCKCPAAPNQVDDPGKISAAALDRDLTGIKALRAGAADRLADLRRRWLATYLW